MRYISPDFMEPKKVLVTVAFQPMAWVQVWSRIVSFPVALTAIFLDEFQLGLLFCLIACVWLFCGPLYYSPPGPSVHGISQARRLEWVYHFILQGIFLIQGSNPCLLLWQVDSYTTEPSGSFVTISVVLFLLVSLTPGQIHLVASQMLLNMANTTLASTLHPASSV